MKVTFKQKITEGGYPLSKGVKIPQAFTSSHYNHSDGVKDPVFGTYINSNMLPAVFKRALSEKGLKHGKFISLDNLPECVEVDTSGFLAVVTIEL